MRALWAPRLRRRAGPSCSRRGRGRALRRAAGNGRAPFPWAAGLWGATPGLSVAGGRMPGGYQALASGTAGFQVLRQAWHQFDQIAGAMPVVELEFEDSIPRVAA